MGVGKILGGMWVVLGGSGLLIAGALALYTPEQTKKVPQSFVCAPESMLEKAAHASIIASGTIEGVLPGKPYADVWVKPTQVYKGAETKFIRFAAWSKQGNSAKIGDLHFSTGPTEYLLFFRPLRDGTLTTSSCFGSHSLPKTGLNEIEQAVLDVKN